MEPQQTARVKLPFPPILLHARHRSMSGRADQPPRAWFPRTSRGQVDLTQVRQRPVESSPNEDSSAKTMLNFSRICTSACITLSMTFLSCK